MPLARRNPILHNDVHPRLGGLLLQILGNLPRRGKGEGCTQDYAPECQATNFRSDLGNSRHKPSPLVTPGCTSSVRAIGCKPVTTGKEDRNIVQQRLRRITSGTKRAKLFLTPRVSQSDPVGNAYVAPDAPV